MFRTLFLILQVILQVSFSFAGTNRVKYYTNLIKNAVNDADSYEQRTDNNDLLGDLTCDDVVEFGKFDFIIVGAGTTGAVLASRLSERRSWNILLLEAGGLNDDLSDIPYLKGLTHMSNRNWGYLGTPQKNACTARIDNRCPIIRGKLLGGTSALDDVLYSRGSKLGLKSVFGNIGWSYNDLLPYFKKVENFTINRNSRYHGFKGPINIATLRPIDPFDKQFIFGSEYIGIPENLDYNGKNLTGSGRIQDRTKNGVRCSSANYVNTLNRRSNLNLTLNAFVTKILIDSNKTTYGVQFIINGMKYVATAKREVIVSAGGINSPQLLKLSGIGPAEELQSVGIGVVQNLPVGLRLRTKVSFSLYFTSNYTTPSRNLTALVKEYIGGKGLFTTDNNNRVVSYIHDSGNISLDPNMAIVFAVPSGVVNVKRDYSNYKYEVRESFTHKLNSTNTFILTIWLLKPYSINGTITLNSSNPAHFPNINLNLFDDKRDLDVMYNGIKIAIDASLSPNGQAVNGQPFIPFSDCDYFASGSREYWHCALRALATPSYFIASTVKMGSPNDPYSVVNNQLKIYGVRKLRVADYAVVPSNSNGNADSLGFVIGERLADFIKNDY